MEMRGFFRRCHCYFLLNANMLIFIRTIDTLFSLIIIIITIIVIM